MPHTPPVVEHLGQSTTGDAAVCDSKYLWLERHDWHYGGCRPVSLHVQQAPFAAILDKLAGGTELQELVPWRMLSPGQTFDAACHVSKKTRPDDLTFASSASHKVSIEILELTVSKTDLLSTSPDRKHSVSPCNIGNWGASTPFGDAGPDRRSGPIQVLPNHAAAVGRLRKSRHRIPHVVNGDACLNTSESREKTVHSLCLSVGNALFKSLLEPGHRAGPLSVCMGPCLGFPTLLAAVSQRNWHVMLVLWDPGRYAPSSPRQQSATWILVLGVPSALSWAIYSRHSTFSSLPYTTMGPSIPSPNRAWASTPTQFFRSGLRLSGRHWWNRKTRRWPVGKWHWCEPTPRLL